MDDTGKRKDPKKDVMRRSGRDALKKLATQDVDKIDKTSKGEGETAKPDEMKKNLPDDV